MDESPVSILIGLLQADNPSILQVNRVTLQPGREACVSFTRQQQPNPQAPSNVVGFIVPNGRLIGQDTIVQDRPGGGGCIAGSVQIQVSELGQTVLYVPMQAHGEAHEYRG